MSSMSPEPMSLGSPTQSPSHQTPQPYLPQFLLGDMNNISLGSPLHHLHGRQSISQASQQPHLFLNHHHQQYGGSGMGVGSQKYWHGPGGSNSPPRSGSGSNFLAPSSSHQHSLIQPPGIGRTYSVNAYDYGQIRTGCGVEKVEPNISGYGAATTNYSPSPLQPSQLTPSSSQQAPGAPPVNRLVDVINTKSSSSSPAVSSNEPTLSPYMPTNPRLNSPPSPTQTDPFYTQGNDSMQPLDDTWVTIFGHPPSATSYVLQEFATYGLIVRYVPPSQTEQGNWLHVKYQTRMQAQKALSKNGKILGGQFMVGVMPCIDRKIMFGASNGGQAASNEENAEPTNAFNKPVLPARGFSGSRLDRTQSLRTNTRPLGLMNRATANDDSTIDPNAAKLPKKNTNVLSKAMEFMFGW